jgi:hypothetical protein
MSGKLTRNEKLNLLVTAMTALAAVLTLVFVGLQWHEMHLGGKDTQKLAEAAIDQAAATHELAQHANDQAKRTRELAEQMKAQADNTAKVATEATIQARAAQDSADAATKSVTLAQSSLELSERPWVSVKVEIAGPLTWDANGAHLSLKYTFKNVGHSPALGFFSLAQMVVEPKLGIPPIKERQELCQYVRSQNIPLRDVLFPDEIRETSVKVSASRTDIEKAKSYWGGPRFAASVIDCTAYHSSFSQQIYAVSNSRSLATPVPAGQQDLFKATSAFSGTLALPIDEEVPADHIVLLPDMFYPTEAN